MSADVCNRVGHYSGICIRNQSLNLVSTELETLSPLLVTRIKMCPSFFGSFVVIRTLKIEILGQVKSGEIDPSIHQVTIIKGIYHGTKQYNQSSIGTNHWPSCTRSYSYNVTVTQFEDCITCTHFHQSQLFVHKVR